MKRTLTIFGIVLFLIILGVGAVWFSAQTPSTPNTDDGVVTRTFSPFGFISDIFTGETNTPTPNTDTSSTTEEISTRSVYDILNVQRAYRVTDVPVAGATFVSVDTGTTTEEHLRYVERETGHIRDLVLNSNNTERVSNTTIPRIQEALWGNRGSLVVLRYLDDDKETIETYVASIGEDGSDTLSGSFLSKNIDTIALNPTSPQVFYLLGTNPGVSGRVYNAETGETGAVFSSPISEWLAVWSGSSIFLSTKPANGVFGFGYSVSPTTGATAQILSNIPALTGLPNSNGDVLVGSVSNNTTNISLYGQVSGVVEDLSAGNTLPEKCVWLSDNQALCAIPDKSEQGLPDSWYQGLVSFSDSFWVIGTDVNLTDYLFDSGVTREDVDAINLVTNSDATLFAFVNKKDSRLWIARVSDN